MITLCQFTSQPVWGINPSPFCMKVETYLRLVGQPYRVAVTQPFRAPKGKLPFIVDQDGRRIADSGVILDHLEANRAHPLDAGLSEPQRSLAHLIRRTCEESLYFALLFGRWIDPAGWRVTEPTFFSGLPAPIRWLVPRLIRRRIRRDLAGQGTLRHTSEEIFVLGCADLDALDRCLGGKPFFVVERPTTADICVHAFLANILKAPIDNPLKRHAQQAGALVAFVERMDERVRVSERPADGR